MTANTVLRDERTISTENASYRRAYLVLSFGLLISTAYRGFVRHESSWDLLGLVIVGGVVATVYQGQQRALSRRWAVVSLAAAVVAAIISVVLIYVAR